MKRNWGRFLGLGLAIALATTELATANVYAKGFGDYQTPNETNMTSFVLGENDPGLSGNYIDYDTTQGVADGLDDADDVDDMDDLIGSSEGSLDGLLLNYQDVDLRVPSVHGDGDIDAQTLGILPSSYNSMAAGKIPSAYRSQGSFGTCWSFAAVGATEASLVSQGKAASSIDLSEAQLAYNFYNKGATGDPLGNTTGDYNAVGSGLDYRKTGGNSIFTMWYLLSWAGLTTESAIPYSHIAYNNVPTGQAFAGAYHVQDVYILNPSDRDIIKQMISEYGAVASSYYSADEDEFNNATNDCYYQNKYTKTNHAIQIIGWDDNFSKDNFTTKPAHDGAWLIKNSWGSSQRYGNNPQYGTFWMSYDDASLSYAYVFIADVAGAKYDNIYQYDGAAGYREMSVKSVANIYTANANPDALEEIKAVGVGVDDTNVGYTVSIYTNVDGNNPINGTLATTQRGILNYAGFQTIELDNPVTVAQGTRYSVVFTFDASTYVFYDSTYSNGGWVNFYTSQAEGTSLGKSSAAGTWGDASKSGYTYRVKAYTKNKDNVAVETPITGVKFSGHEAGETLEIVQGDTESLMPILAPANHNDNKTGVWTSSDPSVATVTDGKITAVAAGTTTIKYEVESKYGDKPKYAVTIDVHVTAQLPIEAEGYSLALSADQKYIEVQLVKAATSVEKMNVTVKMGSTSKTYSTSTYTTDSGKRTFAYRVPVSDFGSVAGSYAVYIEGSYYNATNKKTYYKNLYIDTVILDGCSVGTIRGVDYDAIQGAFKLEAMDVFAPAGVTSVQATVKTENGAYSKTYTMTASSITRTNPSTGESEVVPGYVAMVNVADLGCTYGKYIVTTAVVAQNGVKSADSASETITMNKPATKLTATDKNKTTAQSGYNTIDSGYANLYAEALPYQSIATAVKFAVWSEADGQDDLRWYTATKNASTGVYSCQVAIANHKTTGKYQAQAYITDNKGHSHYIGATTFIVAGMSVSASLSGTTAQVKVSNLVYSNIKVAVWSETYGQDDLVWYTSGKASGNTITYSVPTTSHKTAGYYQAHVYGTNSKGQSVFAGSTRFYVSPGKVEAVSVVGNATAKVKVSNAIYTGLRAAVWSEAGGQDDLRWYDMTRQSDGSYTYNVPISNHKTAGRYQVHIYGIDRAGKNGLVGQTTFNVNALNATITVPSANVNAQAGTFAVHVTSADSISSVRVAVWSTSNQSNLKWYQASYQNGKWVVNANLANHAGEYGTYQCHAYVYGNNGLVRVATTSVYVQQPVASVTSSINAAKTASYVKVAGAGAVYQKLRAAVWSEAGGQDDLRWYDLVRQSDGSYTYNVPISNHRTAGRYQVHIYGYKYNGKSVIVGKSTFTVANISATTTVPSGTVNPQNGTFDINVTSSDSISSVKVAVWSTSNQSNLKWYQANYQNGKWVVHANLVNHAGEYGTYQCHAYVYGNNGLQRVATTSVYVKQPVATVTSTLVNYKTFANIKVAGAGAVYQKYRLAVWSDNGGQDDLRWYDLTKQADGSYAYNVPISNHKTTGRYQAHVYGFTYSGQGRLVGTTNFNIDSIGASITVPSESVNAKNGTFDINVTSRDYIASVKVAVWSTSNQSNLKWYQATYQNGKWVVHANLANHANMSGIYQCHAYAYSYSGLQTLATTKVTIAK